MKDPQAKEKLAAYRELFAKHPFWDTQPVSRPQPPGSKELPAEGEIVARDPEKVRPTPYVLPEGFEWATIDLNNDKEATEVRGR
jgi:glycylpeptide N-tetradecanoyltransferase